MPFSVSHVFGPSSSRQPVGTGASYCRISSKKQEVSRQREGIANWLRLRSLKVAHPFEDVGSRDKAEDRADFQRLLSFVREGRINWIVVQDLDRFGSKDAYELCSFIHQLRQVGCELWSVADDKCLSEGDDATVLVNVIRGLTSEKEQLSKSERALSKKLEKVGLGQFVGGRLPYAMDIECRRGDQVLWRFVPGKGKAGTLHKPAFDPEPVDRMPLHDCRVGEITYLVPSLIVERLQAVRTIFGWYATESVSFGDLARRLNQRGYDSSPQPRWIKERVESILGNPIYTGRPAAFKESKSRFFRYLGLDQNTGAKVVGKAPNKSGKTVFTDPKDYLYAAEPLFAPIVDQETFDKVEAKLSQPKRPRASRSESLWLRGVIVCDHCGRSMHAWNRREEGKVTRSYRCQAANGCRAHTVSADRVEQYLDAFLAERGQSITDLMDRLGDPTFLKRLEDEDKKKWDVLVDVEDRMLDFLSRATSMRREGDETLVAVLNEDEDGGSIPAYISLGGTDLSEVYEFFFDQHKSRIEKQLAEKRSERERKARAYLDLDDDSKEVVKGHLAELSQAVRQLEAALEPLDQQRLDLRQEVEDLDRRIKQARVELQVGTDTQKAEAVRRVIKEIRLRFTYTQHDQIERSHLSRVTIIPLVGERREYQNEGSAGRRP